MSELEKLQQRPTDANDTFDINDVNDITKAFSIIARTAESANEAQRAKLLSSPFVRQVFETAKTKAVKFESQGKWLDAYISCYTWLQSIDKDNQQYDDYAEELLEKANIVASFQDSPCETSKQRYADVKTRMFTRAVDALNFRYVRIIDYREMILKALDRCELLAEVLVLSFSDIAESGSVILSESSEDEAFSLPGRDKMPAWSAGLAELRNEVNRLSTGVSKDKFISFFKKILALNEQTVKLPERILTAQFTEAAFSALDPYTGMIWPQQIQEFKKRMSNEFIGVGIEISKRKGLLTVVSLLPDTPAYKSGLDAGDIIEKVDGVATKDMSITCAVKNITGPKGTEVTLTIKSPGRDVSRDIAITRDVIVVQPIRGWQRTEGGRWLYEVDEKNKIGYVRMTSFDERTTANFEKTLSQLEAEGLNGLVLDLRFNPGGLLNSAAEVVDMFIEEGLIVSTRPRFGLWTYLAAHKGKTHPDYPLVVLINSSSASASEIVAGALQDPKYKRAIIVGERTHGKGSVQTVTSYTGGGSQLKYTMAYYHLPSGQKVKSRGEVEKRGKKDWGIGPDVEIKLTNEELREMFDIRRANDVLARADHKQSGEPLKKYTLQETLKSDPQLEAALLIIKTKLIEAGQFVSNN